MDFLFSSISDLVDWFVKNGVAGLFTVCLSSEMYDVSIGKQCHVHGLSLSISACHIVSLLFGLIYKAG